MTKHKFPFPCSFKSMAILAALAVVIAWQLMEIYPTLSQMFPYLILLLYPLMHLFMHGKHSGHHSSPEHEGGQTDLQESQKPTEKSQHHDDSMKS